jgi:hypothetical protein
MLKRFVYLLLITISAASFVEAQEQESILKAAFIYNFINYIDWDSGNENPDFVIRILGASSVTKPLMQISQSKTVKNKKIVVRIFKRPEDISSCQILFIPQDLPFSLHAILEKVDKGVLTISEEPGYAEQGTAFNFVIQNDKLKFEANLKAINLAGLRAGSQLLKLAKIVEYNE